MNRERNTSALRVAFRVTFFVATVLLSQFAVALTAMAWNRQAATDIVAVAELPPEAQRTLQLIEHGGPFPYSRDGIIFGNYEGRLPRKRRGYYHEFTVTTPGARNRGARRIIAGSGGERYYTDDHYETFRLVTR